MYILIIIFLHSLRELFGRGYFVAILCFDINNIIKDAKKRKNYDREIRINNIQVSERIKVLFNINILQIKNK